MLHALTKRLEICIDINTELRDHSKMTSPQKYQILDPPLPYVTA